MRVREELRVSAAVRIGSWSNESGLKMTRTASMVQEEIMETLQNKTFKITTLILKKCWGNLKQKWKNERSDERRKTHKTGGGPPPTPMSAISVLVGAVAGHMATRLDNDNDSDGAAYLPPVQNEPVVRLLEGMVDCDPVYERPRSTCQPVYGRRRARSKFQYRSNYRSSPGSPHRADHTCSCFKLQQRQGGSYSRRSKAAQREDGAFRAGSLSRE
ncbi:hypothetical protein HPB47_013290 [Ixodes persulcatus]|uniref:Uncharacterized protein n=1 Tax=Ixodes persulcatus TaxID=34615 RepID=A0AC60QZU0_IXOPE|nr:hypothetical protein HPB47_013290 [Ixodes persulcatus]